MLKRIKAFVSDESGPTAVEYAVMLALIVVAAVGSVKTMAQATGDSFDYSASQIAAVFGS